MSLFKQRKPRPFNLKYRVYDEHKERLRESEARVRKKLGLETEDAAEPRVLRPGVFRESVDASRDEKSRNMRLGIIIGLLLICAYLIIHYAG